MTPFSSFCWGPWDDPCLAAFDECADKKRDFLASRRREEA